MKHWKKLLVAVAAVVMAMAMAVPAFAADGDEIAYDTPLTVTGLGDGDVAHFYQVIEWVGNAEGNVAGWKAKAPFDTVLTESKLTEVLVGTAANPEAEPPVEAKNPTGITSELAGQLAKAASGNGTVVNASNGTATLNNTNSGMWMALITPADANTLYNPVFVSADYNKTSGGTIAVTNAYSSGVAKKSTLTLTKTAANQSDYNNDNGSTTAVGDTVTFTVNTTIPGYGDVYTHPHFVLKDTLTDLALVTDSVAVTSPELVKGTDYTVNATAGSYTLTFTETYLKKVKTATPITVTYQAIVTSEASTAVNEEDNEVTIEYSHDPSNESDYDVKKDTTQHYTFSLDAEGAGTGETVSGKKTSELVKIGVDAAGNPITQTTETSAITTTETWKSPLAGAVFGLFTDANGTVPYMPKNADGTAGSTPMTATTGADGRMNFAGLDAGTYYLKEISAPAGFVTNSTVTPVVIAATYDTVQVTEWWNGTEWVSTKPTSGTAKEVTYETQVLKTYTVTVGSVATATYTFTNAAETNSTDINWETAELVEKPFQFQNKKGTELPSTGGMGTTILYIIGGIMVLLAVVFLITKKRVAATKKDAPDDIL